MSETATIEQLEQAVSIVAEHLGTVADTQRRILAVLDTALTEASKARADREASLKALKSFSDAVWFRTDEQTFNVVAGDYLSRIRSTQESGLAAWLALVEEVKKGSGRAGTGRPADTSETEHGDGYGTDMPQSGDDEGDDEGLSDWRDEV
jgi:hypothetical protein